MADIVISEFMARSAVESLAADYDTRYDAALVDDRSALLAAVVDARAIVVRNRTIVDGELLDAAPSLRVVARLGVGLDNIDLDACESAGVSVRPATGANADAVAEYVVAAVLMLLRGVFASSARVVEGEWPRQELVGDETAGRRLGLVGFGDVARRVAVKLRGLGMEVAAHDPFVAPDDPAWEGATRLDLDDLLATCNAVSLHVPLAPETHRLIDVAALARMPAGSVLVNTSRGGVVDEAALVAALQSGHLRGAALDVFEDEPVDEEVGRRFAGVPNLILTPHVAGITTQSNERVSSMTARHVRAALEND
jgi:(S)-sulfolactate dehydrogenase